jgi:glucose/arabinose dehydrogenase
MVSRTTARRTVPALGITAALLTMGVGVAALVQSKTLTGAEAMGDYTGDAPGVRRKITAADLPKHSAPVPGSWGPRMAPWPAGTGPKAPEGFEVTLFAEGLTNPRYVKGAPNGDIFVTESAANRVRILRDKDGDGKPEVNEVFVENLTQPFGIAFYPAGANPKWVYIASTGSVTRFPYDGGLKPTGPGETIITTIPPGGRLGGGGHWTRDIAFSKDGTRLFVSVGSFSNVGENPNVSEERRACILSFNPEGKDEKVYATGIRNPVGIAVHPRTGDLWTSVNEREGLGDLVPPDYITRVKEGGFYGWPWFYIGGNPDPRHKEDVPPLKDKSIVPDVLLSTHIASMCLTFYNGRTFGREYIGEGFAAQHGSSGRSQKVGYKVLRIPTKNGVPTGEFEDFVTGFIGSSGDVYGRPVGITTGADGALYISDDGANRIWKVQKKK